MEARLLTKVAIGPRARVVKALLLAIGIAAPATLATTGCGARSALLDGSTAKATPHGRCTPTCASGGPGTVVRQRVFGAGFGLDISGATSDDAGNLYLVGVVGAAGANAAPSTLDVGCGGITVTSETMVVMALDSCYRCLWSTGIHGGNNNLLPFGLAVDTAGRVAVSWFTSRRQTLPC